MSVPAMHQLLQRVEKHSTTVSAAQMRLPNTGNQHSSTRAGPSRRGGESGVTCLLDKRFPEAEGLLVVDDNKQAGQAVLLVLRLLLLPFSSLGTESHDFVTQL